MQNDRGEKIAVSVKNKEVEHIYLADVESLRRRSYDLAKTITNLVESSVCDDGWVIFLEGELGVGKSCWARGFLQGRGWRQAIPSPSFSLREDYELPDGSWLAHLDLYRLGNAVELSYLGWEELWDKRWTVLIEWPELGKHYLPNPDLKIKLKISGSGRKLTMQPISSRARYLLDNLTSFP